MTQSTPLADMTQAKWDALSAGERVAMRDRSGLHPILCHHVGWRVEIGLADGTRRRLIVGQTTGWRLATLALRSRTQRGSSDIIPADMPIPFVRLIERVR